MPSQRLNRYISLLNAEHISLLMNGCLICLNRYISLLNAELCHIENLSQSDRQRGQIRDVDFRHHSTG